MQVEFGKDDCGDDLSGLDKDVILHTGGYEAGEEDPNIEEEGQDEDMEDEVPDFWAKGWDKGWGAKGWGKKGGGKPRTKVKMRQFWSSTSASNNWWSGDPWSSGWSW